MNERMNRQTERQTTPKLLNSSPVFGMQNNTPGVFKAVGVIAINAMFGQFLDKATIQFRHFKAIQEAVHPVEFPPDPVNRQALSMQNSFDHLLSVAAVEKHPLYHSAAHINPIETFVDAVKVQSDRAGQALQNERVGLPVRWQVPQVVAVAEDEVGRDVAVLSAAASVRLSEKSRRALAHVGANGVFTDLAANAGCLCALIDIVACFAVGHEAVTWTAGADEAGGCVCAVVVAVVNGWVRTLIDT